MTRRPTVALAVSGHGFGHATRCAEVASALLKRGARVTIRTDAPAWLFPARVEHLPSPGWPFDVGVAQHDGLDLDIDATRRDWDAFGAAFYTRAEVEARLLVESGVEFVVGDIPALAFAAAARAGLPSLALGNFGWDWIYGAWSDFDAAIAIIRNAYATAGGLLRLPFHSSDPDAFTSFTVVEDVPLVARRATRARRDIRQELGLSLEARVVLLSFGGFGADGLDLAALSQWTGYTFVLTPPLANVASASVPNVVRVPETPTDYVSLVRACDVVVTKPGYGIVADALANQVAVLYTERGPFREYNVLVEALHTLGRARHVPRADLLAGYLGPHLDAVLESSATWTVQPMNGASVVAERVLSQFDR